MNAANGTTAKTAILQIRITALTRNNYNNYKLQLKKSLQFNKLCVIIILEIDYLAVDLLYKLLCSVCVFSIVQK